MKCAYVEKQGPAASLKIGNQPDPILSTGQVLVRIKAASVNPIDTYLRGGLIPMSVTLPFIPGCDFAGEVVEVASGVTGFKKGDRVWGSNQGLFGRQGSLAELIAVDSGWVYHTPASMTDEEAAAGALTGITAHLGLFRDARLKEGELVFVNGGTGGVGSLVVQFAKATGATVIATAGSQEKRDLAKKLGADVALDYRSEQLDEQIRDAAKSNGGLDVFWETLRLPNVERAIHLMKPRGRVVLMAGREGQIQFVLGPFYVNDLQLLGFAMFNATQEEQKIAADDMNRWYSENKWKPLIGKVFGLEDAAAAHQLQEESTLGQKSTLTGKIVIKVE